jgi:endonuclease/exonuclease/phosphatase family metal-dependent hydrolase
MKIALHQHELDAGTSRLKLLSYNIQAGVGSTRYHHYITHSWKHILPHPKRFETLDSIAKFVSEYDVVALQETDAGSLRSHFTNQTEYLASKGKFPFWYDQVNRDIGRIAQHSLGVLSRFVPTEIVEHKLPGFIPGRGAMMLRFGKPGEDLVLFVVHLALGRRARKVQLDYLSEHINDHEHVIVMGDLNCQPDSHEMNRFFNRTSLQESHLLEHTTYPSWRPYKRLDHILTTPALRVNDAHVLNYTLSDHLPIAMDITLPPGVNPFS